MFGWRAHAFRLVWNRKKTSLLMLSRPFPFGLSLAYVPMGPQLREPEQGRQREQLLIDLADQMARTDGKIFAVRYDLPWNRTGPDDLPAPLTGSSRLKKSVTDVQPPNTVVLDLTLNEESLLAGMKSKTRYNIRLAAKKAVQVVDVGEDGLAQWYGLHEETSRRDRIVHHSLNYFEKQFGLARIYGERAPQMKLLMAYHEGEGIGGIIVAMGSSRAWYLYGASADRKRNFMAGYALQWQAIQMARQHGCRSYDFFGIPPRPDPDHPMAGLYRFKTGFGGILVNRCGCWDVVIKPLSYRLYRAAEAMRQWYFKKVRKTIHNPHPVS